MTKKKWQENIRTACQAAGTYQPFFEEAIHTLAAILEKRDQVEKAYIKDGKDNGGLRPAIEHTNKAGATNLTKNPLLLLWDDLNKSALAYWRDLGLTPAGLKKIDESALNIIKKGISLEEVLADIGG